eukprot:scaffold78707_cov53-Phaeocystis_antarctica.AAC.1
MDRLWSWDGVGLGLGNVWLWRYGPGRPWGRGGRGVVHVLVHVLRASPRLSRCGDVWSVASARAVGARAGRRGWGRDAGAVVLVRLGSDQGRGGSQVSTGATECGLMQWVRAACVRPAPSMRACVCAVLSRSGQPSGEAAFP